MVEIIIGNEKLPSILKNPFSKSYVKRVYVNFSEQWDNDWKASGVVEFTNGNTKGAQNFVGESFDAVVLQIKAFINELQSEEKSSV